MATLPQKLMAERMTNATLASTLDNVVGTFEEALAAILGFTVDVDITVSPFSLNNDGEITKALVLQKAAGPVGWRMRDSTSDKEVRIVVNVANFDIDENTGTEAVPVWSNRFRMALADGALTGALATSARMGLCPVGSGVVTEFLNGQIGWTTPSATAPPNCRVRHSANQAIPTSTFTDLVFDTEDFDTDTMHSTVTNTNRITCVTAGKYLIIGQLSYALNTTGDRFAQILKNGSTVHGRVAHPAAAANTSLDVRAIVELIVGDYVTLQARQTSLATINVVAAASYSPVFSALKIG